MPPAFQVVLKLLLVHIWGWSTNLSFSDVRQPITTTQPLSKQQPSLFHSVVHVQLVALPKYGFAQLRPEGREMWGWGGQSPDSRHLWLPTIILDHNLFTSGRQQSALMQKGIYYGCHGFAKESDRRSMTKWSLRSTVTFPQLLWRLLKTGLRHQHSSKQGHNF